MKLPGNASLYRARALSRVAEAQDEHYAAAEEAVAAYLDRPLYALTTLINKQEGLGIPAAQRKLLVALLISACRLGQLAVAVPGRAGAAAPVGRAGAVPREQRVGGHGRGDPGVVQPGGGRAGGALARAATGGGHQPVRGAGARIAAAAIR